jgi:gamma-glutamylcyclotransferase (GGCT)/AIG2-like uncharacterized protein YtfP
VPEVKTEEEEPGTLPVDDKKMESEYLFVYGGLKRGGVYHKNALSDAEFLGEAMSRKGKYALFSPNDQWPVLFKGHYRVKGELYRINQAILNRVDWIEGHPQLFQRVLFKIKGLGDLVYVYKGSDRLISTYEDLKYESDFIITDKQNHTQEWILP